MSKIVKVTNIFWLEKKKITIRKVNYVKYAVY